MEKMVEVDWFGHKEEVEEKFASLLREIWKAKVWTFPYCDENSFEEIYIHFIHSSEAEDFCNIIRKVDEDFYQDQVIDGPFQFSGMLECDEDDEEGGSRMSIGLRFPKRYYFKILEIFKAYNADPINILTSDIEEQITDHLNDPSK